MDLMDIDHNMELDIDLVPDEPIVPEPDPSNRSPGEIDDDEETRCPSKVYIKGLDAMNPTDVKAYVAQHCSDSMELERIEWIDDSSANLLFASESVASRALASLAAEPTDVSQLPARHLLRAKPFSTRPDIILHVRPSFENDKKQAGAALRSRFYLLNPEYDPEERRRRDEARRYRSRDGDSATRRHGRQTQTSDSDAPFDVNLYDDSYSAATAPTKARPRRRRSHTPNYETSEREADSYPRSNRGRELFPESTGSRRRTSNGRSASPARDRDGDLNMNGPAVDGSAAARERNHHRAHAIKSHMARQNRAKELFPAEATSGGGRLGDTVEDTATLLSKGIMLPLMDGSSDKVAPPMSSGKLEDRITIPGKGKLADRVTTPESIANSAFNIRGVASQKPPNTGFSIKGTAAKSARELFPDRFGNNAGKELFGGGSGGRPRQRPKASDLFD
ncbi:hypothetical protein GGR50DRAFT_698444 [Xylaria sp. CBS 124048]|nr:hypothetical protein GGR50DRAFT_698444 [Xylaria sp. CBS 124048]